MKALSKSGVPIKIPNQGQLDARYAIMSPEQKVEVVDQNSDLNSTVNKSNEYKIDPSQTRMLSAFQPHILVENE